jgi:hypothetical protein
LFERGARGTLGANVLRKESLREFGALRNDSLTATASVSHPLNNWTRSITFNTVTITAIVHRDTLWLGGLANLPMTCVEEVRTMRAKTVHGSWMLRTIWLQMSP